MLHERLLKTFKRMARAKQMGIKFVRQSSFMLSNLPNSVMMKGKAYPLHIPPEHGVRAAFLEVLLDDCYGLEELSDPIKTILDIGANVGLFGVAARRVFLDAIIHAYEPNPGLDQYLRAQSNVFQFKYFMEAVGLEQGKVSLTLLGGSDETRSTVDPEGSIPQISFAQAIVRLGGSVDLVKLDCEGAEWEILKDISVWNSVKNIAMEYHLWTDSNHSHEEIRDILESLGFKIKKQQVLNPFTGLILGFKPNTRLG